MTPDPRRVLAADPCGRTNARLVAAAGRAGGIGIVDTSTATSLADLAADLDRRGATGWWLRPGPDVDPDAVRAAGLQPAMVVLSPADRDTASFTPMVDAWAEVAGDVAVGRVEEVSPEVFEELRGGEQAVVRNALPRLARAIREGRAPFVLVLDDVHRVRSPAATDALRVLAEHVPPGSRLVLASRSEPDWPMARLRVAGRIDQLDASALEMTPGEGAEMLRAGGAELARPEADAVVRYTEGWAAALYLASLALRARPRDARGRDAVPGVRGRDRPLADYFRDEVLVHASPEQAAFIGDEVADLPLLRAVGPQRELRRVRTHVRRDGGARRVVAQAGLVDGQRKLGRHRVGRRGVRGRGVDGGVARRGVTLGGRRGVAASERGEAEDERSSPGAVRGAGHTITRITASEGRERGPQA